MTPLQWESRELDFMHAWSELEIPQVVRKNRLFIYLEWETERKSWNALYLSERMNQEAKIMWHDQNKLKENQKRFNATERVIFIRNSVQSAPKIFRRMV